MDARAQAGASVVVALRLLLSLAVVVRRRCGRTSADASPPSPAHVSGSCPAALSAASAATAMGAVPAMLLLLAAAGGRGAERAASAAAANAVWRDQPARSDSAIRVNDYCIANWLLAWSAPGASKRIQQYASIDANSQYI